MITHSLTHSLTSFTFSQLTWGSRTAFATDEKSLVAQRILPLRALPLLPQFKGFGTERARLGTKNRGFGTERARLGTFRGFGTERARLGTLRGLGNLRFFLPKIRPI